MVSPTNTLLLSFILSAVFGGVWSVSISSAPTKCNEDSPRAVTSVGTFCGSRETVVWQTHGKRETKVDIYYGIRFAQPPVGSLRFKKPVPPNAQTGKVFDANTKPDACFQYVDTMYQSSPAARMWQPTTPLSEDCLFLNIFVPVLSEEQKCEKNHKLPVMVWIFGGSFTTGSSVLDVYDGRILSTRQNVIVVTLNYRLGPFGFLYLNNSWVPGNMGLWDQRLAIKWVKDHIADFQGDPSRITLFGESAGAVSVSAHLISPWSHAFFQNAILQSGSVFSYWGVEHARKQLKQSEKLVELVGCGGRSGSDLHSCLQLRSPEAFIEAQDRLYDPSAYFSIPLPPVLDGHFLPYTNSMDFQELGHLKPSGSVMMGVNANEGSYFLLYAFVSNASFNVDRDNLPVSTYSDYYRALYKVLDIDNDRRPDLMEPLVMFTDFEYMDLSKSQNAQTWTQILEEISSDRSFKCPTIDFALALVNKERAAHRNADLYSITRQTFFYEFAHRTESLPWPSWGGAMHGYEIEYVFGIPYSPVFSKSFYRFTEEEKQLSDKMMTYWANFARTGNPNILPTGQHVATLTPKSTNENEALSARRFPTISDKSHSLNPTCLPHHLQMHKWDEFRNHTQSYLILNVGKTRNGNRPKSRQCLFWRRWFPTMMQQAERISGICPLMP